MMSSKRRCRMLQQYLIDNRLRIADLSRMSDIPYATLSDLVRNIKQIDDCKVGNVKKLAEALNIDPITLYELCIRSYQEETAGVFSKEKKHQFDMFVHHVPVSVYTAAGKYTAEFSSKGKRVSIPIISMIDNAEYYVKTAAEWVVEDYIEDELFEGWV